MRGRHIGCFHGKAEEAAAKAAVEVVHLGARPGHQDPQGHRGHRDQGHQGQEVAAREDRAPRHHRQTPEVALAPAQALLAAQTVTTVAALPFLTVQGSLRH